MTDLSERAIALIMWERTVAAYSSALTGLYLDSWHEEWGQWMKLCREYLTARGWEPLP